MNNIYLTVAKAEIQKQTVTTVTDKLHLMRQKDYKFKILMVLNLYSKF